MSSVAADPDAAPIPVARPDEGADAAEYVRRAAARWAGRSEVAERLRGEGAGGIATASALSNLVDACVGDLYEAAVRGLPGSDRRAARRLTAALAIGGTGRGEVCPHSDVDVLLIGPARTRGPQVVALHDAVVRGVVQGSWDAGLPLAHLAHTSRSALAAMRTEIQTATALVEARPVCGDPDRGRGFVSAARALVRRRSVRFCRDALNARLQERATHGDTPFLLEPDLKRASGGLRDAHLMRWIALATCGTADPDELVRLGVLTAADRDDLVAAVDVLLDVRCGLHLLAGRGRDVLTRADQLRLIPEPSQRGPAARRAVEAFMRRFLTHGGRLAELTDRFVSRQRPRSWRTKLKRALRRPLRGADDRLTAGPRTLDLPEDRRGAVAADPRRTLSVFGVAARTGSLPSPELADAIREAAPAWPGVIDPGVAAEFDALLAAGVHTAAALRSLHRHGVLGWLLPPMEQVRCLTQFNQYHSYTVDEHSLRCVEAACGMLLDPAPGDAAPAPEPGADGGVAAWGGCDETVSAARRAVTDPALLTLAVLLHDCGKGAGRDHSVEGAERVWDVATRLGLSPSRRSLLVWLVAHHLKMTHLVLRRDTADPAVIFRFAREVGDVPRLRMLYVLSAADLRGVGPSAWTAWKGDLLASFYEDARRVLDGGRPASREHAEQRLHAAADAFADSLAGDPGAGGLNVERASLRAWAEHKLRQFSPHLIGMRDPDLLTDDLRVLYELPEGGAAADGRFDPQTGTTEYRLAASSATPGLFARLAGALAARRLEVVDAVVESLEDGSVLDLFRVLDRDFLPPAPTPVPGSPSAAPTAVPLGVPPWRVDQVAGALREAAASELTDDADAADSRARVPAAIAASRPFAAAPALPAEVVGEETRVTVDVDSSDTCTVFDVFAGDAPGLMFALAAAIAEQGLTVRLAKISTHLDQVVDVFYVTDCDGAKVTDPRRLDEIHAALLNRVRTFEADAAG